MSRRNKRRKSRGTQGTPQLDVSTVRALAAALGVAPEPEKGMRTPKPDASRWRSRNRLTDLDLSDVTGLLRRMEDGDVRDGVDFWFRALKSDEHLASVWESRISSIHSAPYDVAPGQPKTHAAEALARACREMLDGIPDVPSVNAHLLDAIGTGFASGEIVWKRGTLLGVPAWTIADVVPVHSRRFRFDDFFRLGLYDDGMAVSELRRDGWDVEVLSSRGAQIAALPRGKYLTHMPTGIADYPTSRGVVHPIARPWWVKNVGMKLWLNGAELAGNPRLIGTITQLANGQITMQEFFEQLESLASDGVAVLREGAKIEMSEPKSSVSSDVWDKLVKRCEAGMSKALLGSTLNVEIGDSGGNRAAAESQGARTIDPRQDRDQAQLWSSWRKGPFRFLRDFNPHLFPADTPLPTAHSVLVEDEGTVDETVIATGYVTIDQILQSRRLPPIGGEVGRSFYRPAGGAVPANTPEAAPSDVERPAEQAGAEEDVQSTAFNGAQIDAADRIIQAVIERRKPRPLAVEQLVEMFQMERSRAQQLIDTIPEDFVPATTEPAS